VRYCDAGGTVLALLTACARHLAEKEDWSRHLVCQYGKDAGAIVVEMEQVLEQNGM